MATSVGFQLGILPERKMDRRALAASYGLLIFLIIVMINIGWIWPDSLNITAAVSRHRVDSAAEPAAQAAEDEDSTAHLAGQTAAQGAGF